MDVIALVGSLRYRRHCSVTEIHEELSSRGMEISPRSVINLLDRYDELVSLTLGDNQRLQRITQAQGCVTLAIDGMQPDVGHEVLWVLRDCLSGEVLLAKTLLSSRAEDLGALLEAVVAGLEVPVLAVISDGQSSIRKAVKESLPEVPHGLCHYHYLREAARPIYEADRNAKKELKKRLRGIRPLERRVEGREDPEARVIQGYCNAVRSAITDDGRPPLEAAGLKLHRRTIQINESLERLEKGGGSPKS
jgi:hypothetical protein